MEQKDILVRKVIEEYGILRLFNELGIERVTQNGTNVYSVCPMHEGSDNPNAFSFSESKGFGYCFTRCQRSYDLFDIVMHILKIDFREAMQYLADLIGFQLDYTYHSRYAKLGTENRSFLSQIKKVKKIKDIDAPPPFDINVLSGFVPRLHTFFRKEGFDEKVREYFNLGYARDGYLEGRVTIPIDNIDGNIISVSGRLPLENEEIDFTGQHKYKIWFNTDKGKTLYNISRALPYIQLMSEVIIVEGFKSVWRLHQYGIDNVVASMGSSLTEEQRKLILNLNCNVVVCGDNDEAGRNLNKQVLKNLGKFTDVSYIDMSLLDLPKAYSPAELKETEWRYLYENKKSK